MGPLPFRAREGALLLDAVDLTPLASPGLLGPVFASRRLWEAMARQRAATPAWERWRAVLASVRTLLGRDLALPARLAPFVPLAGNVHARLPIVVDVAEGCLLLDAADPC